MQANLHIDCSFTSQIKGVFADLAKTPFLLPEYGMRFIDDLKERLEKRSQQLLFVYHKMVFLIVPLY